MTRLLRALTTVALITAAMWAGAAPAGAATLGDAGWWWKPNPGQRVEPPGPTPVIGLPQPAPEPPAPPTVPEGGLFVSRGPEGATAIAAVRFDLDDSESNPVLELTVASGGQAAAEGDLLACQTGSAWTGSHGGRWDDKPLVECDPARGGGSVTGEPADDGSTWTFALEPLVLDGAGGKELDVAIVPALDPDAPAGAQPPFELAFEEVTDSSLDTTRGASDFDSFPAPSAFIPPEGGAGGAPPGAAPSSGFGFEPPPTPPPGEIPAPALGEDEQGLSATAPSRRKATDPVLPQPAANLEESDAGRAVAVAVLLLVGAAAYAATRQKVPALQPLARMARRTPVEGSAAGSARGRTTGGLGRFTRPRTGPPPRL